MDAHDALTSPPRRDPVWTGLGLIVLSSVAYAGYNVLLRLLADRQCDAVVVNAVQAISPVLVLGPWLLLLWQRSRAAPAASVWPSGKGIAALVALGIVTQLGGVAYQLALERGGVAVVAAACQGVLLAASALLGRAALGEHVVGRAWIAIALVTLAITLLSLPDAPPDESEPTDAAGVGASCLAVGLAGLSGIAFAILTVGVRKAVTSETRPEVVVLVINLMGVLFLGAMALALKGPEAFLQLQPTDVGLMLAAGVLNLAGFFFVTKALAIAAVVRVNALGNLLSTGLTVVAGLWLFCELMTAAKIGGLALAIGSIWLFGLAEETPRQQNEANTMDRPAECSGDSSPK